MFIVSITPIFFLVEQLGNTIPNSSINADTSNLNLMITTLNLQVSASISFLTIHDSILDVDLPIVVINFIITRIGSYQISYQIKQGFLNVWYQEAPDPQRTDITASMSLNSVEVNQQVTLDMDVFNKVAGISIALSGLSISLMALASDAGKKLTAWSILGIYLASLFPLRKSIDYIYTDPVDNLSANLAVYIIISLVSWSAFLCLLSPDGTRTYELTTTFIGSFLLLLGFFVDLSVIPIIILALTVIGPIFSASNGEETLNLFVALFYFTQVFVQGYSDW